MSKPRDEVESLKERLTIIWRAWMNDGNRHSQEWVEMNKQAKLMRAVIQNQAETIMVQARTIRALRRRS